MDPQLKFFLAVSILESLGRDINDQAKIMPAIAQNTVLLKQMIGDEFQTDMNDFINKNKEATLASMNMVKSLQTLQAKFLDSKKSCDCSNCSKKDAAKKDAKDVGENHVTFSADSWPGNDSLDARQKNISVIQRVYGKSVATSEAILEKIETGNTIISVDKIDELLNLCD